MVIFHSYVSLPEGKYLKIVQPSTYWCVLRREFSGMIHWLTINFIIPATPSNPSSNPTFNALVCLCYQVGFATSIRFFFPVDVPILGFQPIQILVGEWILPINHHKK